MVRLYLFEKRVETYPNTTTYSHLNSIGSWVYVKIIAQSNQGIKTFTAEQAAEVSAKDPDYATNVSICFDSEDI